VVTTRQAIMCTAPLKGKPCYRLADFLLLYVVWYLQLLYLYAGMLQFSVRGVVFFVQAHE
jgi:hypothetical protein